MYNEVIMDHFMNPRNVGAMADPDGVGRVEDPVSRFSTEISIRVRKGRIIDAKFRTFGCGTVVATGSMVTELVKGRTLREAMEVSDRAVAAALKGLPPTRIHCSNLAADALHAAIEDYEKRREV